MLAPALWECLIIRQNQWEHNFITTTWNSRKFICPCQNQFAVFKNNNVTLMLAIFYSSVCYIHLLNRYYGDNRTGQSLYVCRYVSGTRKWHLAGCSAEKMWRTRGQQPSHGGMFLPVVLVLRGLKNEMCLCSSEHFCCQVSAVPIYSSHRSSRTHSAINQIAASAEQGPVVSLVQQEIKASRDVIKRLQPFCWQAEKEPRKRSWSRDLLVT